MKSLISVTRGAIRALATNRARHALALSAALSLAPLPALAATQVHGTPDAVSIEVKNASVDEILLGLGKAFDLEYQSSTKLEKQLTGTYRGSLQRVVARVLQGYNFIVKSRNGKIEITVLAPQPTSTGSEAPVQSTKLNGGPAPSATTAPTATAAPTTTAATVEQAPAAMSASALPAPVIRLAESKLSPLPEPAPGASQGLVPEVLPSPVTLPGAGPAVVAAPGASQGLVPEVLPSTVTLPGPGPAVVAAPEATPSTITLPAPANPPTSQPTAESPTTSSSTSPAQDGPAPTKP